MPRVAKKIQDDGTRQIYAALKAAFPRLDSVRGRVVYRYNPVAIRVRVIDPSFAGLGSAKREWMVMQALRDVPREVLDDITMLIMATPDETEDPHQLLNLEFDDPTGSRL